MRAASPRWLLPFLLFLFANVASAAEEPAAVKAAFGEYKKALLAGHGAAAAQVVDRDTIAYYARMKELALGARADVVKRQSLFDRMMIVMLRHRMSPQKLRQLAPEKLFAHGVEQGWIGKEGVAELEVGDIQIDGAQATAVVVRGGQRTPLKFLFQKEQGKWLINLRNLMNAANHAFALIAKQQQVSEDELILSLTEQATGKKVRADVWDPPRR
jgi:hypothetical protein